MMGRQTGDQSQFFYLFNLEERIPGRHLLRRINPIVTRVLADLREKLGPFYSEIGRPSIDPELMLRMLIVGYCYGVRFERRLCEASPALATSFTLPPSFKTSRRWRTTPGARRQDIHRSPLLLGDVT
jgi:transposase